MGVNYGSSPQAITSVFGRTGAVVAVADDYEASEVTDAISGLVSSTDNGIARWSGAAGDTLEDSSVLVSDDGDVTIPTAGQLFVPDGTSALPSIKFPGLCGFYGSVGGNEFFTRNQGGTAYVINFKSTYTEIISVLYAGLSTQSATVPGISRGQDANTGISLPGSDIGHLIAGGVNSFQWRSTYNHSVLPLQFPSLDDTARGALTPAAGLVIFNTADGNLNIYDGTNWILPDGSVT